MDQEKIGLFIKQKRIEKDLTQKDLASKLNVTVQAVSKWERGKGIPDVSLLDDLSKELDTSIVEILKGEEQEDKDDKNIEESIKYANKSFKQKINLNIMKISWTLLIIALVGVGIKYGIYYYFYYKNYDAKIYNKSDIKELNKMCEETTSYINTLKSSQGNYSEQEYFIITKNIEQYEKITENDNLINIESKNKINIYDVGNILTKIEGNSISYTELSYIIRGRKLYNNLEIEETTSTNGKITKELGTIRDASGSIDVYYWDLELFSMMTPKEMYYIYKNIDYDPGIASEYFIYEYIEYYHDSFKALVEMGGYNEEV